MTKHRKNGQSCVLTKNELIQINKQHLNQKSPLDNLLSPRIAAMQQLNNGLAIAGSQSFGDKDILKMHLSADRFIEVP